MAKNDMRRIRMAATVIKADLSRRLDIALENSSSNYDRLNRDYLDAARLEYEARKGELAAILNEKVEGAGFILTKAAEKLEAEVDKLQRDASSLNALADAVDTGTYAVGLFHVVANG